MSNLLAKRRFDFTMQCIRLTCVCKVYIIFYVMYASGMKHEIDVTIALFICFIFKYLYKLLISHFSWFHFSLLTIGFVVSFLFLPPSFASTVFTMLMRHLPVPGSSLLIIGCNMWLSTFLPIGPRVHVFAIPLCIPCIYFFYCDYFPCIIRIFHFYFLLFLHSFELPFADLRNHPVLEYWNLQCLPPNFDFSNGWTFGQESCSRAWFL